MTKAVRNFGVTIRFARERRSLSQEALAELAGLSRNFLGDIERGKASPTLETMWKLAEALGEKLSTLIKQCEEMDD